MIGGAAVSLIGSGVLFIVVSFTLFVGVVLLVSHVGFLLCNAACVLFYNGVACVILLAVLIY